MVRPYKSPWPINVLRGRTFYQIRMNHSTKRGAWVKEDSKSSKAFKYWLCFRSPWCWWVILNVFKCVFSLFHVSQYIMDLLLMEEILHHLGCKHLVNNGIEYLWIPIIWCRVSSINSRALVVWPLLIPRRIDRNSLRTYHQGRMASWSRKEMERAGLIIVVTGVVV